MFVITVLDFMVLNLHSGIMKNHLQSLLVLLVVSKFSGITVIS